MLVVRALLFNLAIVQTLCHHILSNPVALNKIHLSAGIALKGQDITDPFIW